MRGILNEIDVNGRMIVGRGIGCESNFHKHEDTWYLFKFVKTQKYIFFLKENIKTGKNSPLATNMLYI